ncbi:hypothetical protein C7Y72_19070 [Paraconexibacter algicola]|uniref:Transglycosylase SLT domain-containing protein n=2 Tax=Paraconexibacter algicola TaxID=2133960 RepID=A0A2T4UE86_9ACTN|nr:hypothetical protein C7Y72_19070 [Paraconexibacter algicola]
MSASLAFFAATRSTRMRSAIARTAGSWVPPMTWLIERIALSMWNSTSPLCRRTVRRTGRGWFVRLMLPPRRPAHVPRYACSWHYGYVRNPGTASVGYGAARPGGGSGDRGLGSGLPSWVPAVYRPMIARAAQRWNVGAVLLAAQLRTESNFNPHARSSAGALGIAQFMPGTAQEYGLHDPFDPAAAIDAQARLMRRLLQQFAAVPLALAAYNAGPGAVQACRCAAPYSETRDYVARILALMLGQGDIGGLGAAQLTVRLVR